MYNVTIIRYGEISIKSPRVREKMENILIRNIKTTLELSGICKYKIKREKGRIFIYSENPIDIAKLLTKVFGIVSTSPAIEIDNDIEVIKEQVLKITKEILKDNMEFAIRARRVKSYKLTSKEIERIIGEEVLMKSGLKLKVNLENPDKIIYIEIRKKRAYIYYHLFRGYGGLPYGVEGKVISLVSGGVDSAISSWLIMKRGCEIIPIHYDLTPYYTKEAKERAIDVLKWLRKWVPKKKFKIYLVPLGQIHSQVKLDDERYRCLLCKSLMYKIAEIVCIKEKAKGIVTGESMGQVASQTLDNLYFLSSLVKVPIYRPVIGFDKEEIIKLAKKLNVFEIAGRQVGLCKLVPKYPITHIEKEEIILKYDLKTIANKALEKTQVIYL